LQDLLFLELDKTNVAGPFEKKEDSSAKRAPVERIAECT